MWGWSVHGSGGRLSNRANLFTYLPVAGLNAWHLGVLVLVIIIARASALSVSVFCSDPSPEPDCCRS
jgi:hypothetical protein